MALSRSNRAIEAFDISLMAVVTKAMGAFLVLMLVLYQDQTDAPKVEEQADQAQADQVRNEQVVAVLKSEHLHLVEVSAAHAANLARLRQEVAELEHQQAQSGGSGQTRPQHAGYPALILRFSKYGDGCGGGADFYVRGENVPLVGGAPWPEVQKGSQPSPFGVLAAGDVPSLLQTLVDFSPHPPSDDDPVYIIARSANTHTFSIEFLDAVQPGWKFAVYAKFGEVYTGPCSVTGRAFLTTATKTPDGDRSDQTLFGAPTKSGQIVLMGHLVWENDRMNYTAPTADEQADLDKRFQ